MKSKKVIHCGGACRNRGTVLISSCKCNFSIYLDIQVYYLDIQAITTLLRLLLVLYVLVPSIDSFFYLTTTLLKSDVFRHLKAYSSHSFQPTGIGLGSLWRGNRGAHYQLSRFPYKLVKKFLQIFKIVYFAKKYALSKNSVKFTIHFF